MRNEQHNHSDDLLRVRLDRIIWSDHPLVRAAEVMHWEGIAEQSARLAESMHSARRLKEQRAKGKKKLYAAIHAPGAGCISKGKARQADESGVKVGCAFTAHEGLIVGARSFRVNLCGGDTLVEELE